MDYPLQPFPELVMEPNHTCLLLTLLLSPLVIWLAEMLIYLRKKITSFSTVFQNPAQSVHTIANLKTGFKIDLTIDPLQFD